MFSALFTEKDITVTLFSGTGAGGQNRNKCQKCVRIVHHATGIIVVGQAQRSLEANKRAAYAELERRLIALNTKQAPRVATVVPVYAVERRIADKRFNKRARAAYND